MDPLNSKFEDTNLLNSKFENMYGKDPHENKLNSQHCLKWNIFFFFMKSVTIFKTRSSVNLFSVVQGPFTYTAKPPGDIKFVPLNQTKEYTR